MPNIKILTMGKEKKINLRQKLFCEYYCGRAEGNACTAAILAGYSQNYAKHQGYKLLDNVGVKKYIEQINRECTSTNIAEIKDIQSFWTEVMNDPSIEIKYRIKASELLAKCKGMFDNDW